MIIMHATKMHAIVVVPILQSTCMTPTVYTKYKYMAYCVPIWYQVLWQRVSRNAVLKDLKSRLTFDAPTNGLGALEITAIL